MIQNIYQVKFFCNYRLWTNNLLLIILIFNLRNGLKFICKIAFAVFQIRIKITLPSNLFLWVFFQILWTVITFTFMRNMLLLFWLHLWNDLIIFLFNLLEIRHWLIDFLLFIIFRVWLITTGVCALVGAF